MGNQLYYKQGPEQLGYEELLEKMAGMLQYVEPPLCLNQQQPTHTHPTSQPETSHPEIFNPSHVCLD